MNSSDVEDIEQELALRVWQGLDKFDPAIGHQNVFVTTLVERAASSLLRRRRTRKRGALLTQHPLDVLSARDPSALPDAAIDGNGHIEHVDLAHDVAAVRSALPVELRQLAEQLSHSTIATIAREGTVSRTVLYERLAALRTHFAAAGLKKKRTTRRTLRRHSAKVTDRGTRNHPTGNEEPRRESRQPC